MAERGTVSIGRKTGRIKGSKKKRAFTLFVSCEKLKSAVNFLNSVYFHNILM